MLKNPYQFNYSSQRPQMYDIASRTKKATRMISLIKNHFGKKNLSELKCLDMGCSTEIIANYLANFFSEVVGIDVDQEAIEFARKKYKRPNLTFKIGDALHLPFTANSFQIIICAHLYEHVPNVTELFTEIKRVLKPQGVCYLAAQNKIFPWEPHYNLPFLSLLPKKIANVYLNILRGKKNYYEHPLSYWGLKNYCQDFLIHDYTAKIVSQPFKFSYTSPSFLKFFSPLATYFSPTFFWILEKK